MTSQKKEQQVSISLTEAQVYDLITQIIDYRIADPDRRVLPDTPMVAKKLCVMSNTMIEKKGHNFAGIKDLKFTPAGLEKSYTSAALSMLEEEVNWGRLIAYFTFTGLIAIELKKRKIDRLDELAQWATAIVLTKIQPWIRVNGGWVSIVSMKNTNEFQWIYITKWCTLA